MSETSALRPDRLVVVALVVAVGALAVAIWALLSAPSAGEATSADEASSADETSSGGEDSSEEAGARVCGAGRRDAGTTCARITKGKYSAR